jgi:hypothetical protein
MRANNRLGLRYRVWIDIFAYPQLDLDSRFPCFAYTKSGVPSKRPPLALECSKGAQSDTARAILRIASMLVATSSSVVAQDEQLPQRRPIVATIERGTMRHSFRTSHGRLTSTLVQPRRVVLRRLPFVRRAAHKDSCRN